MCTGGGTVAEVIITYFLDNGKIKKSQGINASIFFYLILDLQEI